jgi:glucose/arabinose dehydrogenase
MKKLFYCLVGMLLSFVSILTCMAQTPTLELDKVLIPSSEMAQPWGMCFISADELLFTEKSGKLYRYVISTNAKTQITGVPAVSTSGQGGLLDVAIHPEFASNKYVYLSYSISGPGGSTLAVGRGVLDNNQLTGFTELFRALPFKSGSSHYGSRIAFDKDNHLIFSSSERQEQDNAQLLENHLGKIIRLKDDGTVPADNPFIGVNGAKPELFSYGHRNVQGLVVHPETNKIYAHEHGPMGGDELNLVEAGKNYGWPKITFGKNYNGSIITNDTAQEGMEQPIRYWVPSIAPCGMAIVNVQNQEPNEVNFILGALAGMQIQWVKIKDDKHVATYSFMHNYARFRDIEVSPDGKIYALTENPNRLILLKTNQIVTGLVNKSAASGNVRIYPNPVTDVFTIDESDLKGREEVAVCDHQGKVLRTWKVSDALLYMGQMRMDISDLPSGSYLILLKSKEGTSTIKCRKL